MTTNEQKKGLDAREASSPRDERVTPSRESMAAKDRIVKLVVTNSALTTFLDCRMRYVWRYVHELAPITSSVPLLWGDAAHKLIEYLYSVPMSELDESVLDSKAKSWIDSRVAIAEKMLAAQPFSDSLGGAQVEEARERATTIAGEALGVVRHYIGERLADDHARYEFHWIEKTFRVPLPTIDGRRLVNTVFAGKWDLVATDKATGICKLWDHKFSIRNLDELQIEGDTDTQPLGYLYAALFLATAKARNLRPGDSPLWSSAIPTPKGFIHNWIRRSVPGDPPLLSGRKTPTLSRNKQLVTTVALYREALEKHGIDPVDYEDHLDWLAEHEQTFVRRTEPNIGPEEIARWAEETVSIARDVRLVLRDDRQAYRNPRACRRTGRGRCPYIPLCFGDANDPGIRAQYKRTKAHSELDDEENGG